MFGYLGPNLKNSRESAHVGASSFMTHSPMADVKIGFQPSFNSIGSANTDKLFCIDEEDNSVPQLAQNALKQSTAIPGKAQAVAS